MKADETRIKKKILGLLMFIGVHPRSSAAHVFALAACYS
jgi:hypothetical protein